MSKKRKTRQQKIIAELRRKVHTTNSTPIAVETVEQPHYSFLAATPSLAMKAQPVVLYDHSYLKNDLGKTVLFTAVTIASQLILYFLLQKHVLSLPNIF